MSTAQQQATFPTQVAGCSSVPQSSQSVPPHQGLQGLLHRPWRSKWRPGPATSWPAGGGALRGLRRTSNISRQVTSACKCIYINFPLVTYRVSGVCTLAVQRWSKRESCRRSRVRTWFAPFLNPDFYWYIPAQTSTYWYNTVHTGTTQYIPVCTVRMC